MLDRNPLLYSIQDSYLIYTQLSIRFFFQEFYLLCGGISGCLTGNTDRMILTQRSQNVGSTVQGLIEVYFLEYLCWWAPLSV